MTGGPERGSLGDPAAAALRSRVPVLRDVRSYARDPLVVTVVVAVLGLAVGLVLLVTFYAPPIGSPLPSRSANLVTGPVGVALTWTAVRRLRGKLRRAWTWMLVSGPLTVVADVLWVATGHGGGGPALAGVAEAVYLVALVPFTVGLLRYPFLRTPGMWRVLLVDVAVLLCGVVLVCYVLVLRHLYAADLPVPDKLAYSLYPLGASLLVSLLALVLLRTQGEPRLDLMVGCLLMATMFVSGSVASLSEVSWAAPGWMLLSEVTYGVTPLLIGATAWAATAHSGAPRVLNPRLEGVVTPLVPDLVALTGLALMIALTAHDWGTIALGTLTLAAVGVRQLSQTSSGEQLRGELEGRVTERTEELDELTAAYQRLESMKLEFVTAVSHELRTPLASIRGSLEMLHDGDAGALPKPALTMIDIAGRGSERLSRLVNDIIDLERLESGTFGFSPQLHDLPELVGDAVTSLEALAMDGSVRLRVETVEGRLWCDADRITQVLVNLIGNALTFAPDGSTVTVAAREEGEHVVFSVSDQGPGIPPEQLEAIFDRFHQVEMDDSRQRGGAGLGLTICRHIVQRHGGRIWAENTDEGARISFVVPHREGTA